MKDKGDIIILGSYPQSSKDRLKREPIEWIVLDTKDDSILCISKYLLDCKPYNKKLEKVTWETSGLRNWLNDEFLCSAFSENEQKCIIISDVESPVCNTQDRIFLLSGDEAETYFSFEERAAQTTFYARTQGAWFFSESNDKDVNNGSWWLRYPNWIDEEDQAFYDVLSCVNYDGNIETFADEVNVSNCSVRPVFWLKL